MHALGGNRSRVSLVSGLALTAALILMTPTRGWTADPPAAGQPPIEGRVLAVEPNDLVVDLAAARGAHDGQVVEIWRPLVLTHPVTGKKVRDRFLIGRLRLRQVRDKLALAVAEGQLEREPAVGDVVLLRRVAEPPATAPAPATPAGAPGSSTAITATGTPAPPAPLAAQPAAVATGGAAESAKVAAMFERLRGTPLAQRVQVYDSYLRRRPRSRYARAIAEQRAMLRRLAELEYASVGERAIRAQGFAAPKIALADRSLDIALRLQGPATGAVLHARRAGEVSYVSRPMTHVGDGYYGVTVPAEQMHAGELEYFIEATTASGKAVSVVGKPEIPNELGVRDNPRPEPPEAPGATVSVWSDYADYNRFRGDDVAFQTEGQFEMRYGDTGIRALRTGFGVYRGVGGSLEDLDQLDKSPRAIGLTYGYLETEIGFHEMFSVIARAAVGLEQGGLTGGGQAMVRIGNDQRTNLLLGGELLGGVGMRAIAELDLAVFERFPMMLRTEVTNQPAGSRASVDTVRPDVDGATAVDTSISENDIGARGIAQVGWRIVDPLVVSVRGSYQGRTIKHSGPGFGGAVSYSW